MKTTIRILIDFSDPFAEKLLEMSGLDALYVRHLPFLKGKKDPEVWAFAQQEERILLARDGGFSRKNYPVCRHRGIIRFKELNYDSERIEAFRKFLLCGRRVEARNAITYLQAVKCVFEACDQTYEHRYE